MSDESLFREVDEDVRRERLHRLWKAYGPYVVGAAVLIVVVTAGSVLWRDYRANQRAETGARFQAALDLAQAGDEGAAAQAFAALAADAPAGYRALARLQQAEAVARDGDAEAAVTLYDSLAADDDVDQVLRDLARLRAGLLLIDHGAPGDVIQRVDPLTGSGPWQYSARELVALARLKAGDAAAAKSEFQRLVEDPGTPAGVRARAGELLATIGGSGT